MQKRWVVYLGVAMLAGAMGGALLGPAPVGAVAREIVELQQSVNQLIQGQQTIQTALTQNQAVEKTLIEQQLDSVNKLSATMGNLQKNVEDIQATSGARLDTMSTQVQGVSDNLQELLARMGKLNQQLTDAQNAIQSIDAKLASAAPPAAPAPTSAPSPLGGDAAAVPSGPGPGFAPGVPAAASAAAPPPSSDLLYSNGLRDLNGRKYDLAGQEFQDYLKYYSDTDLASNAQFYLGEIAFAQEQFDRAVDAYGKVIDKYPKSFKLAPAHLKRGLALIQLGERAMGVRELRLVLKLYPGTDEDRRARAKLHDLGETT